MRNSNEYIVPIAATVIVMIWAVGLIFYGTGA